MPPFLARSTTTPPPSKCNKVVLGLQTYPIRALCTRFSSSCCRTQFVNHVYNSQQLSNKALLAGHLAYRHDHHRRRQQQLREHQQCSKGRVDPSNSCGNVNYSYSAGFAGAAAAIAVVAAAAENNRPVLEAAFETEIFIPEAFFPRCWNVSDDGDGVCSMLKAFAVSAAVALLRTAVKAEVWLIFPAENSSPCL